MPRPSIQVFFGENRKDISREFQLLADKADEIVICSPWINNDLLRRVIQRAKDSIPLTIVTSSDYGNEIGPLSFLYRKFKLKVYIPDRDAANLMHIKLYGFRNKKEWTTYMGSMNLTEAGVYRNTEVLTKIKIDNPISILGQLINKAFLVDRQTLQSLSDSNAFLKKIIQAVPARRTNRIFVRSLPLSLYGVEKSNLPPGLLNSGRQIGSLILDDSVRRSFSLLPFDDLTKVRKSLDSIRQYVSQGYLYPIPQFGHLTTVEQYERLKDSENVKLQPKIDALVATCKTAMKNFEQEPQREFTRRLLTAVEAQRKEWIRRLGKSHSRGMVSVKAAADKLQSEIASEKKRDRLLNYLNTLIENSRTEGLRIAFQFNHLDLANYMGPPHEVYAVLLEEIVSALANKELLRKSGISRRFVSIISTASDWRASTLIEGKSGWQRETLAHAFQFLEDLESEKLCWDRRLDFTMWSRFNEVLDSIPFERSGGWLIQSALDRTLTR